MQKWAKDFNRHFFKNIQVVDNHMKHATSLSIREMKNQNHKGWQECRKTRTLCFAAQSL
jgi:hypothetical protein